MNPHPLRCRCGQLQGSVTPTRSAQRVVCYCRDCRAYAHHLGGGDVLDAQGATEIVAMRPSRLQFDAGTDALQCLALSRRGPIRWYAACCRTPVANTARSPKIAYAGLVHTCLQPQGAPALQTSFGALRLAVHTEAALAPVPKTPLLARAASLGGLAASLLGARLGGGWRDSPFFDATTLAPVRTVQRLTPAERAQAYDSADRR